MSQYHVFLPPTILSPLDTPHISRLAFRQLPLDASGSGTQSAFTQSQHSLPPTEAGPSRAKRSTIPQDDAANDTSRASNVKRSRGPLKKSQTDISAGGLPDEPSRRRSTRIGRRVSEGHDGMLGTLPGSSALDGTESFMSLNTTVSNPSQLPPTADQSSLLNFPRWSIPLAKLTPLPSLLASGSGSKGTDRRPGRNRDTAGVVSLIACVLSVDQPVLRQRKEQKARGQEGTLWIGKWIITAPPPTGGTGEGSCVVKLWDQMARVWGDERVRKGDVVLLEGVKFTPASTTDAAHITISDQGRPKITVLYRTMPRYHSAHSEYVHATKAQPGAKMAAEDRLLRPDLRLGRSDMGVRKVAEVARWLAELIGGDPPSL